jgi:hypothetical protein
VDMCSCGSCSGRVMLAACVFGRHQPAVVVSESVRGFELVWCGVQPGISSQPCGMACADCSGSPSWQEGRCLARLLLGFLDGWGAVAETAAYSLLNSRGVGCTSGGDPPAVELALCPVPAAQQDAGSCLRACVCGVVVRLQLHFIPCVCSLAASSSSAAVVWCGVFLCCSAQVGWGPWCLPN